MACSFGGCDKAVYSKGWCLGHYNQQRRGEELRPLRPRSKNKTVVAKDLPCSFEGCDLVQYAKELCRGHYAQLRTKAGLRALKGSPEDIVSQEAKRLASEAARKPRGRPRLATQPAVEPAKPYKYRGMSDEDAEIAERAKAMRDLFD